MKRVYRWEVYILDNGKYQVRSRHTTWKYAVAKCKRLERTTDTPHAHCIRGIRRLVGE